MTWREAIANVATKPEFDTPCPYALQDALGLENEWVDCDRIQQKYIASWICTDTRVGLSVYFFDGEPVAVSGQSGRKSREQVEFLSLDAAGRVRNYLESLIPPENRIEPSLVNLEEEIDPGWFEHAAQ